MQINTLFTLLAVTFTAVIANPTGPYYPPPPPPPSTQPSPPGINHQVNYCSSGSPYCCSLSETLGTTCQYSNTQCNSISIYYNTNGPVSAQTCSASAGLPAHVYFVPL